uniref:Transmembrane channel-like protein n=1 Tax=Hucho hucho TaxID=62062 RepID=A0A4W5JJL6_9TELE
MSQGMERAGVHNVLSTQCLSSPLQVCLYLSVVIPCLAYLQKYTCIDRFIFNSNMDSSTPVVVFSVIATRCVVKPAEFDVARNVLDLINAQTLAWIGVYFSPLLPVVQLIKLFPIFHLKKTSIRSCHPPSSWSRVAQMQTLFISLLFFPCYLGTLALLAYTLWRYTHTLTHSNSKQCRCRSTVA